MKKLAGKKIAVLAADGFEYVELAVPVATLKEAGAEVDVISLHGGRIRGVNLTMPSKTVAVDKTLDEADPREYDGLFIPGGLYGPDLLRQSETTRWFVRVFDEANKPVAALCHGPWLLASAERMEGRVLASWPGIRDDVIHAGGVWRDEPVVQDGNWVTSRGPQDLPQLLPAMVDLYSFGATERAEIKESSPPPSEPLKPVVIAARVVPSPLLTALAASILTMLVGLLLLRKTLL